MPALIDSSPACVVSNEAAEPADDAADFVIHANYEDCAGFMTFGPGSTYGEDGQAAETAYMILTWLGIIVTLCVLFGWIIYENRQLIGHVARLRAKRSEGLPPEPGMQPD